MLMRGAGQKMEFVIWARLSVQTNSLSVQRIAPVVQWGIINGTVALCQMLSAALTTNTAVRLNTPVTRTRVLVLKVYSRYSIFNC